MKMKAMPIFKVLKNNNKIQIKNLILNLIMKMVKILRKIKIKLIKIKYQI